MALAEESDSKTTTMTMTMMIDDIYEFSAPRFFDFVKGETDDECREAEVWFDSDRAYAPSRKFDYSLLCFLLLISSDFIGISFFCVDFIILVSKIG